MFTKLLQAESEHEELVERYKIQIEDLHSTISNLQIKAEKERKIKIAAK